MNTKNLVGEHSNQNPFYYIENELEISVPYQTNKIGIKINNQQSIFIKQLNNNKSDKLLFLNDRQNGLSTIMMSYCYWLCTQVTNTHIGVFTYNLQCNKSLQTKVVPKENVVTLNSSSGIQFNNGSTINFINNSSFFCDKQISFLFVDNAPNFGLQEWKSLEPCLTRYGHVGKLVVLSSGEERKYIIPVGLQNSTVTTIIQ